MEEESQWSHLPGDILKTIADKLNNTNNSDGGHNLPVPAIHNLRLRSVCKSWRSSPIPANNLTTTDVVVPFPIAPKPSLNPNRHGHFILFHTPIYLLRHQLSSTSIATAPAPAYSNWLLRVENSNNRWRPLNPLSRVLTSNNGLPRGFPPSINLLNFRIFHIATSYALRFVYRTNARIRVQLQELKPFRWRKVAIGLKSPCPRKVVVSTSGPLVAMAISGSKLYCIKVGDEKWGLVDDSHYGDVVFRKGKFYAVDIRGRVVSVGGSDLKALEIVPRLQFDGHGGNFKYLLESNGELFLIDKYCEPEEQVWYDQEVGAYMAGLDPDVTVHLKIYKLNEEKREWEMVNDLDDHVFFVGDDCSYSISARDFPSLKPNCVYFCDDSFIDYNKNEKKLGEFCAETGVYCLDDGTCGPLANFPDHWPLFWPPPA